MTDREKELQARITELEADLEKQKEIAKEWVDQHTEDLKTIAGLQKRCAGTKATGDEILEKLFFAIAVAETLNCNGATAFLKLLDLCELSEQFKEWKEENK